ncbi:unnamed protein product [Paramecium sonneborni]|uniref:Transmembrane protein n=1 Tax=Paramecium sonneborni TaxID=65129 RepID=A0A8S1PDJ8_9CILI|nr:unnamed protein product [Paramecium sonneborni]
MAFTFLSLKKMFGLAQFYILLQQMMNCNIFYYVFQFQPTFLQDYVNNSYNTELLRKRILNLIYKDFNNQLQNRYSQYQLCKEQDISQLFLNECQIYNIDNYSVFFLIPFYCRSVLSWVIYPYLFIIIQILFQIKNFGLHLFYHFYKSSFLMSFQIYNYLIFEVITQIL